jgi:hypothetical protein
VGAVEIADSQPPPTAQSPAYGLQGTGFQGSG